MEKEFFTPQIKKIVADLSQKTGKPPDYFEQKARQTILEMLEDEEDYWDAVKISQDGEPTLSFEEVVKALKLENKL